MMIYRDLGDWRGRNPRYWVAKLECAEIPDGEDEIAALPWIVAVTA